MYFPRSQEGEARRLASIPKGKNHWNFSKNPSKNAIHKWLNKWYGKANKCVSPECNGTSKCYDWAKIKGKRYAKVASNFMMLCRKCHTKYDMTSKRRVNISRSVRSRYKQKNNTSGYRGVYFQTARKKWAAQIKHNGKCVNLGRFSDKNAAALAYNKMAKKLFGDDANLNKIKYV